MAFYIGQKASVSKTIAEQDVIGFAEITGDRNPLHLDEAFARTTRFGGRIAHGALLFGLLSGVMGTQLPGAGGINLSQSLRFLLPVHLNDTITAVVEVTAIRGDKGILTLKNECFNQYGEKVAEGQAVAMHSSAIQPNSVQATRPPYAGRSEIPLGGGAMDKRIVFVTLGLLVLIVVACASPTPAPPPVAPSAPASPTAAPTAPPAAAKPIKVGLLTDQTGALAIYGPMQENGVRLGLEYATEGTNTVAGRPIQLIVKDTASNPDTGTQAARDLIEKESVDVLFGPPSSGVALAVDELAKQYKKIVIHLAASPDLTGKGFNPYVFRTGRTSVQDALAMGAALTKMGQTFVQIAPDYAFGYGGAAAYYGVLKANGGKFTINDTPEQNGAIYIPIDTKDLTPYLQRVLDSKAQVLVVTWSGASIVPLMTQMQQLGITKSMTVAIGFPDTPTLKAGYAGAVGWVGLSLYHPTLPKNSVNDWFVKQHKAKYNSYPDFPTEVGFSSAQMFVLGVKATDGDTNADKLAAVYEKGFSFDGPKGKYTVRPYDHVMLQSLYLVKLNNVTDPDVNFYTPLQEVKPEDTAPPCALEGEYKSRCPTK